MEQVINGVSYPTFELLDGEVPIFRLYNSDASYYYALKNPDVSKNKTFTLPPQDVESGLSGILICDEDYAIGIQTPTVFRAFVDPATGTLAQVIAKLNNIISDLRTAYIIQPVNINVHLSGDPAIAYTKTFDSTPIIPEAATVIASSEYGTMTTSSSGGVASTIDPTFIMGYNAYCIASTSGPTVTIT